MQKIINFGLLTLILGLVLAACSREIIEKPVSSPVDTESTQKTPANNNGESPENIEQAAEPKEETPTEPEENKVERSFSGKVPAPEFPQGLDWLNIDRPLSLGDLRGKVVLLDFWTYGCINCIHIIPDLKKLEEKYADELVVIGVHSAKFSNEGETENIRNVILRYELEHPVVNDHNFQIWNLYGATAWPTLVLIDPEGKVLGYHAGEGIYEPFDAVISGMVDEFNELDLIDRTPLDLKLEKAAQVDSPLLFPGKVLADSDNKRLFIADSNHNRIVITDMEGIVLEVIGDGHEGLRDGDYALSSFFRPQGLALANDDTLYVADTENNVIRKVDLAKERVTTVAGTGEQVYMRFPTGQADATPLNSPWDVLFHEGMLYIAMAGQHQIWAYNPENGVISLFAGSGREELQDGPRLQGGLNQPSGLATDGEVLYIADSEASAIRTAEFAEDGELNTIVGTGLFDFGDVDGSGKDVRLQHPLGIDILDGFLYVADTYNSKIKIIDQGSLESKTFLGSVESGWRDGLDPLFNEPGGLSIGDGKIYIADTNNHVIREADLDSGEVSTIVLVDMNGLLTRQPAGSEYTGKLINSSDQSVGPGAGSITVEISVPPKFKVNDLAPFSMEWTSSNDSIRIDPKDADQRIVDPSFPLTIPVEFSAGKAELTGDLVIYYCESESQSLCLIERVQIQLPVTISEGESGNMLNINYGIPQPGNFQQGEGLGG
jgi:thiol-disulfide isomerase/thioredoxin